MTSINGASGPSPLGSALKEALVRNTIKEGLKNAIQEGRIEPDASRVRERVENRVEARIENRAETRAAVADTVKAIRDGSVQVTDLGDGSFALTGPQVNTVEINPSEKAERVEAKLNRFGIQVPQGFGENAGRLLEYFATPTVDIEA